MFICNKIEYLKDGGHLKELRLVKKFNEADRKLEDIYQNRVLVVLPCMMCSSRSSLTAVGFK